MFPCATRAWAVPQSQPSRQEVTLTTSVITCDGHREARMRGLNCMARMSGGELWPSAWPTRASGSFLRYPTTTTTCSLAASRSTVFAT